jgi:hypothetical protein
MLRFRVATSSREDSMRIPTASFHTSNNNNNNSLNSSNTSVKSAKTTNLSNILTNNNRIYSKTLANAGINANIGLNGNSSNITNSFYPRTVLIAKNYRHSTHHREKIVIPQTLATFPLAIQNNSRQDPQKYAPPVSSISSSSRSTTPKVMQSRAGRMSSLESARSNATPIDCSCIFCLNKLLLDKRQQKSFIKNGSLSIVDTKSFLNSLKNLKTSVKLENFDNEPNASFGAVLATPLANNEQIINVSSAGYSRLKTASSTTTGQSNTTRVLSKTSRIKLWKPNEINEFTNENRLAKSGKVVTRENDSNGYRRAAHTSFNVRQHVVSTTPDLENKNNLNRVFQDLNLNPNLSPLLIKAKDNEKSSKTQHEDSDSEQLWSLTNSDDFDDKYPRNPPTTPINPLFKVIITSKEKS